MKVKRLALLAAEGHVSLHNIVDSNGRRLLRKGVLLGAEELATLARLGYTEIEVAILEGDDVGEDEAALTLGRLLETPELTMAPSTGGRVNLQAAVHGVLYVDTSRLYRLNQLPGITLATCGQHAIVKPERGENRVATLKVIPYALPQATMHAAVALLQAAPALLDIRPLAPQRLALLISGDPAAHVRLQRQFETPIRNRLLALNSDLDRIECVSESEAAIGAAVPDLLAGHDGLILAGQTSIMDLDDLPLRALRALGAGVTVHGAPVDPGNLLALAYLDGKPILCAPGCARSPARNVMDLVLPRLLAGETLTQAHIAELSLGGILE